MINYYENEDFNRIVYTIDSGTIEKHTLADLCREYADESTSPKGVEPRYHLRGNELWTWGPSGNCPHKVCDFKTTEEAEHALLLSFKYDLYNGCDNPIVYDTIEEAEKDLNEIINN